MQIIQLVLISVSVLDSFQEQKNLVHDKFLNATQTVVSSSDVGLNIKSIAEYVLVERLRQALFSGGSTVIWGCGIIFCLTFADTPIVQEIPRKYQTLRKHGYTVETHSVITEDGYILRMQRIPKGRNETENGISKPAILLIHGMFSSAADWFLLGPDRSLGYLLADSGFDVWLGNNRGNTWSRNHVRLDPNVDVKEFWDFSFEDCGRYDLPAKIDFIIDRTGQKKIFFIGHSQGTTEYFAMATLRPEYNDKIALMLAFAPVAFMEGMTSPVPKLCARHLNILRIFTDILNIHEFLGHSKQIAELVIAWCSDGSPFQETCVLFLFLLCGFNPAEMEKSLIPVLGSNAPAGASVKMIFHYGQEVNSGFFRQYDYGRASNLIKYNSPVPPNFNLSAATAPIALYYGQNDFFAAVEDVEKLASELPNVVKKKLIDCKLFNHLDFIFAKHVNEFLNNEVLDYLRNFKSTHASNTAN